MCRLGGAGGAAAGHPEGGRVPSRWRMVAPLFLLVLLLVLAGLIVVVPIHGRLRGLHAEVFLIALPARAAVHDAQLALARQRMALQSHALAGDETHLEALHRFSLEERRALARLRRHAARLGPEIGAASRTLAAASARWHEHAVAAGARGRNPDAPPPRAMLDAALHEQALLSAGVLRDRIEQAVEERRREIEGVRRLDAGLSLVLIVAALVATLLGGRSFGETRRLQRALVVRGEGERARRHRSLFTHTPNAVVEMDREGRIVDANAAASHLSGYSHAEMVGMDWHVLVHPDCYGQGDAYLRATLAGQPQCIEFALLHKHGWRIEASAVSVPIVVEGRVRGIFSATQDITGRKRAERERAKLLQRERAAHETAEERRRELERLMEAKARLIRGFGHDLKNPLGAIIGYCQLLESGVKGELEPDQRESIARIRQAAERMRKLIDDLVDLARTEVGKLPLELAVVDVAGVVREALDEYRAGFEAAGLELETEVLGTLPETCTDPARVRQILGNLLSNAVKYTPAGGRVAVRAAVATDDPEAPGRGRWIRVDVSDTGPGIPEEQQERIFEEFTRGDSATSEGAGLGLAISRRIARLLGGDVTVRSVPGRGSTFALWLPISAEAPSPRKESP